MMYIKYINLYNYNYSIFKKNKSIYLYVYNNNYFCLIKISNSIEIKIVQEKQIKLLSKNNNLEKMSIHVIMFLKQFNLYENIKIKFTGKGYKIKKNSSRSMILLFNRSHITTMWWKNVVLKKLKKYKMYIKHINNPEVVKLILKIRPINIFTKKGLRKSRQVLLKKKGKK